MRLQHNIIILAILLLSNMACKRFLDQEPLRQTSIKTTDQLQALVDNIAATNQTSSGSADETNSTAGYSTDDTEINAEMYKAFPNSVSLDRLYYYTFDTKEIPGLASDPLWSGEFRKIFIANTILANVDKVTGPEQDRSAIKADAHFIRAYSNWLLVNHYCLPYSQANLGSPGLPLKKTAEVVEPLKRATLSETYDFIISDLNEAMKVSKEDVDPLKRWRVSKKTVEAMFSRMYLFMADYTQALDYANKALTSSAVTLKDYKTIVAGTPITYNNPSVTLEVPEMYYWGNSQAAYWQEFYYPRFTNNTAQFYIPSNSLLASYEGQNDLRYKWMMIENGGRRLSSIRGDVIRYSFFSDGRQLISGLTRAELILIKAEALARTNRAAEAMSALNELRAMRFKDLRPLSAADNDQAIAHVLAERRREFPFSMRWMDIRRYAVNDYPKDDVTVTRSFFKVTASGVDVNTPQTYTLSPGSSRYMVPINAIDINASNGQLEQNKY